MDETEVEEEAAKTTWDEGGRGEGRRVSVGEARHVQESRKIDVGKVTIPTLTFTHARRKREGGGSYVVVFPDRQYHYHLDWSCCFY